MIKRDDAFNIVAYLQTPSQDNTKIDLGTGFFISKENKFFLVTAAHVTKKTNFFTVITISKLNTNENQGILLRDLNNKMNWMYHSKADVAVLELFIPIQIGHLFANKFLPLEICSNSKSIAPSRDIELTTIGFPNGLGVDSNFCPLTFRSYAASGYLNTTGDYVQKIFFLENPSCGGYSGGPVIDLGYYVSGAMIYQTKTVVHGLIHGTSCDNTGGKMAIVTPSFYLYDLIK